MFYVSAQFWEKWPWEDRGFQGREDYNLNEVTSKVSGEKTYQIKTCGQLGSKSWGYWRKTIPTEGPDFPQLRWKVCLVTRINRAKCHGWRKWSEEELGGHGSWSYWRVQDRWALWGRGFMSNQSRSLILALSVSGADSSTLQRAWGTTSNKWVCLWFQT